MFYQKTINPMQHLGFPDQEPIVKAFDSAFIYREGYIHHANNQDGQGNKNFLLEYPPKIRENASEFAVHALARNSVIRSWCQSFITELDHCSNSQPLMLTNATSNKVETFPKSIGIGLKTVFSLVKQSRKSHPDMCKSALKILLDTLDNFKPEDLVEDPAEVMEEMFDTLIELSALPVSGFNEDDEQITSLSCSCLLALVVASGSTSKIMTTISHLLKTTEALAHQCVVVPRIMTGFYQAIKHIAVGSNETFCFMQDGVQEENIISEVKLPVSRIRLNSNDPFILNTFVSDSTYLYLFTTWGIYKIGTGFSGSIKSFIYKHNPLVCYNINLIYHKKNIYVMVKHSDAIYLLNKETLDPEIFQLVLPQEFYNKKAIHYSDVEHIGLIYPNQQDRLVLNLYEINITEEKKGRLILVKKIFLNLAKQYTYILGWPPYDDDVPHCFLEPTKINHDHTIVSVAAGQHFTLCRTALGQVYFNGNPATLGIKGGTSVGNTSWNQLYIGKNVNIVDMAVGHDGRHAVLITEDGVALYYGTPQRGEDGDMHKYRKTAPVRSKPFTKLDHEFVMGASCNYLSTALVTKSGKLYIYGKDSQYSNSIGLVRDLQNYNIVEVSLGKAHGVALTDKGEVITFGINNKGQCGRFGSIRSTKFCQNRKHKWEHDLCMLCTKCGNCTGFKNCTNSSPEVIGTRRICGCGEGHSGCADCGICLNCAHTNYKDSPRRSSSEVSRKSASFKHNFKKVSSPASSPVRGSAEDSSAASDNDLTCKKANLAPAVIDIDGFIVSVSCGLHHTVLLSDQGQVFTFGLNSSGQLGTGDAVNCSKIVKLDVPKAVKIAAGSNHTVILLQNGDVLTMGANNKGQLGRTVEDDEAKPLPVAHFGTAKGCKATWIGASGDQTFIKLDESIVNLHLLQNSIIVGDKRNLLLIPFEKQSLYKQLIINKKDGECFSFDKKGVLEFEKVATVFDPGFDFVWDFNMLEMKFVCYGHFNPRLTRNTHHLNLTLPTWDFTYKKVKNQENVEEMEGGAEKNIANVLTKELSLTMVPHALVSRQHLAMNLLACVDTINCHEKHKLFVLDYTADYDLDKKPIEYSHVNRFTITNSGWEYRPQSVEGVRFCADHNLIIGGIGLYGSRGEYTVRVSIYDIGFDGAENERVGELLAETDDLICEAPVKNKFTIMFDTPITTQANCWYVITTHITGPTSECGSGGLDEIFLNDVTFQFKTTNRSTNGTDVTKGQIPCILFKKYQRLENISYDIDLDPIYSLKCLYAREITPAGLDSLYSILEWVWNNFMRIYKQFQYNIEKDVLKLSNFMEKYTIICHFVLRLVRGYLVEIYPLIPPKKYVEKPDFIDLIFDIRQQLNKMLSYNEKIIKTSHGPFMKNAVDYANKMLFMVLSNLQNVYEDLFYIFYPSPSTKWKHLCNVLKDVKDIHKGRCTRNIFLLNAVCTSLTKCLTLRKVLRYMLMTYKDNADDNSYILLFHKMAFRNKPATDLGAVWTFQEAIDVLLSLVNGLTLTNINDFLAMKHSKSFTEGAPENYYLNLVKNCCSLLIRIVSELTYFSSEDEFQIGLETKEYFITPSRFCFTNSTCNWVTKKGFPDAIAFEVDRPGICILGVTVYGGIGEYVYELEILADHTQPSNPNIPIWSSLEYKKGTFSIFGHEPVDIKFIRPIPIKENAKYAIRLWNLGRPSKSGSQGLPIVKGPDGTIFTFSKCNLSMNGTNVSIGQIPSLIYMSQSKESTSTKAITIENELEVPKKEIASICRQIIKKSCYFLNPSSCETIFKENPQKCHDIFEESITFSTLVPFVLAQLAQMRGPENCVETFNMIQEILPHIVTLNSMYKDEVKLTNTAAAHTVTVESEHPYRPSNVIVQCVKFPPNIGFMVVEMDRRCGTCQPEDSLTLYIPHTSRRRNINFHINSNLLLKHDSCDDYTSYISIGQKYRTIIWPNKGLLIPGNEVLFYMETAADYIKDEKANKFGFKCQVYGYESIPDKFSVLQKLEFDFVHIGGICAASLINPDMSTYASKERFITMQDDSSTAGDFHDSSSLLANGLALQQLPTIKEALSSRLIFRLSNKHRFLQDFIKRTANTPGGRLSKWLQPDPFVDPSNCYLVSPTNSIFSGEKCEIILVLRDQHNRAVTCPDIYVELTAHQQDIVTGRQSSSSAHSSQQGLPLLNVPYTVTTKENMQFHCITMMKAYQNYSLEELRMASPSVNRTTEHLVIRSIIGDKVMSIWTPQSPGTYTLDCAIDGYNILKGLQVHICEPLEKKEPPVSVPLDLQKPDVNNIRTFVDEDSAGLRIRAFPSLQSEQIGLIPSGSIITFDDVALNGDGVWLKLSNASISHYIGGISQDEAWCMQFNQHLGKSLLQPNEIDNNDDTFLKEQIKITDIGVNNVVDLKTKYKVIKTCDVKTMPTKSAPVIGTLISGDVIKIKHTFSNLVETWVELSSSVIDRYGFISNTGECWVLRSCLQTILDEVTHEDGTGIQSHNTKSKRNKKKSEKIDITVVGKKDSAKRGENNDKYRKYKDTLCEGVENIQNAKSVSFGGAIRKVKNEDSMEDLSKDESNEENKKPFKSKRYSVSRKSKSQSPQNVPASDEIVQGPSKTIETSETDSTTPKENLPPDSKPPKAISPSRAESLRASFAAFLWHEGIVDDALTCASYLKFQPNLPKEGSEVITRPPPLVSQPLISQRHSVEVTNAGNYLNIQQSTLESLNKSGLNASANRNRKRSKFEQSFYKEVSMISEEENSQCSDDLSQKGRDVVCVLPAAFRALVALWEEFGELQIQDDDVDRTIITRRVISPPKKCSDKDSSQHSTDSDDNFYSQDITHVFENCEKQTCELCMEVVSLPMTNHYVHAHEGCGRFSCRGYNYTGLYTKGWFGKCGTTETTTLGLGYIYCDVCHEKNLKDLKVKMEGGQIDEPPGVPNVHHLIMISNSMFLLDIEPVRETDENSKTTSNMSLMYVDPLMTPKEYNSLLNLSSSGNITDENQEVYEYKTNSVEQRPNTGVHRSASMSIKSLDESLTSASSLLCNPSKALLKLVGIDTADGQAISSVGPIAINKDVFYSRPAVSLLCQGDKDIQKIKLKMENAVRTATIRKYGFQAMNWLIHTASQPMSLHDLMWMFCGAMIDNSNYDETRTSDNDGNEETGQTQWWCDWLAGTLLCREVRTALHRFLQSVSNLIPHLPLTSPLLLQAIQCWGINFSSEDHHFLHDSQIFNNISRILSNNEEATNEEMETATSYRMEITGDEQGPTLSTIHELTHLCSLTVSSRQDMVDFLTDGSTETFWESSEENRTKPRTIDIALPQGIVASTVWIHLDNVRDAATRALGISVSYSAADGIHKELVQDISVNYCGWVSFSLHDATAVNRVIHCELRGICNSVRVRQVKLFGALTDMFSEPIPSFNSVIRHTIQNETLHVFRNITYQVFGPVIFDDTLNANDVGNRPLSIIEDGHYNGHNDLREHVVGILFSQETLTVLQKQLMVHIVNAITSEAQRTRDFWENNLKNVNDNIMLNDQDIEINEYPDDFCYEMISMVLTLSGCPLGRCSLSKYSFLIRDLLTLLHTGSARVQRQVIAVLRRMIDEVTPVKMMSALSSNNLNGNMAPKEIFFDHLISCISKSLRVQVKNKNDGAATISQPVTMARAMEQAASDPSCPWYYRGYMSKRHAQMIIQLLNDMVKEKMSSSWGHTTTLAIAEYILALTNLSDEERTPSKCIASPILWRAMGSLCVVTEDQANRLNNKGWQNGSKDSTPGSSKENTTSTRPMCVNHDDGETLAMIECSQCGPMCQDCDRFLHLSKLNRNHQRQVCKEEVTAIQVELHEGCGRVKLFWLLAFVDQRSLKSIVEFRLPVMNKFTVVTSKSTGQCRFCGAHGDTGLLSIGNVCAEKECQDHSKNACTRILPCGHHCGGYKGEVECLPCLHGCAYMSGETPQQEEAASKPSDRPILRQDAEDMCMICFSDRLIAAPAVLLLCGHVFHYHCTKKILENRWIGPRISFAFSLCPICKVEVDHPAFKDLLEPIRNLQKDVRSKALIRLEYESLNNAAVIATRYNGSAIDYAMDRYSYYVCFTCKKAYFGGEAHCDAESSNTNHSYNPSELVCGGCSDVTQSKMCKLHGSDYLEYKCRYCCTIAIFFCLGDTHFCGGCHDQFQVIRRLSLDELPCCPAGPKGVQLEGTSDDCPLRVKHPPTGYEFALGCGICRNNTNF